MISFFFLIGARLLIIMGLFSLVMAYRKKLQLKRLENRIDKREKEKEKEKGKGIESGKELVTKKELGEVIEGMRVWFLGCLGVLSSLFIFRANYLAEGSLQVDSSIFFLSVSLLSFLLTQFSSSLLFFSLIAGPYIPRKQVCSILEKQHPPFF